MRISDWSSDVCSSDLRLRPIDPDRLDRFGTFPAQSGRVREAHRDAVERKRRLDHVARRPRDRRHDRQLPFSQSVEDRKSTTSELPSLMRISYAVFCLKKKTKQQN